MTFTFRSRKKKINEKRKFQLQPTGPQYGLFKINKYTKPIRFYSGYRHFFYSVINNINIGQSTKINKINVHCPNQEHHRLINFYPSYTIFDFCLGYLVDVTNCSGIFKHFKRNYDGAGTLIGKFQLRRNSCSILT